MTIDEAVKVLNERKHDGVSSWKLHGEPPHQWVGSPNRYPTYSPITAIAIAEKYQREDAANDG